jgi:proteasome accessory factor C
MPETAATQLNRLVQLVAEMSRRDERHGPALSVAEIARHLDVAPNQILRDIRVLTETTEDPDGTWLSSLTVVQQGDRIEISSRGPYRRPIRLTPEELLALQVALVTEPEIPSDAVRQLAGLANTGRDVPVAPTPFIQGEEAATVGLVRLAMNKASCLKILYAGEGAEGASERVIEPHDLVSANGAFYVVSWCRTANDWRRFRADRIIEAEILPDEFALRLDVPQIVNARDVFRAPDEGVVEMTVRFSRPIARWLMERYPDGERQPDGSYVLKFKSASVDWGVRTVLQYGPDAEILAPPAYRSAMRRALEASA